MKGSVTTGCHGEKVSMVVVVQCIVKRVGNEPGVLQILRRSAGKERNFSQRGFVGRGQVAQPLVRRYRLILLGQTLPEGPMDDSSMAFRIERSNVKRPVRVQIAPREWHAPNDNNR